MWRFETMIECCWVLLTPWNRRAPESNSEQFSSHNATPHRKSKEKKGTRSCSNSRSWEKRTTFIKGRCCFKPDYQIFTSSHIHFSPFLSMIYFFSFLNQILFSRGSCFDNIFDSIKTWKSLKKLWDLQKLTQMKLKSTTFLEMEVLVQYIRDIVDKKRSPSNS